MASYDRNLLGQTAASDHEKQGSMPVKAEVVGAGKRPTRRGSAETFTGVVFQELLTTANLPSRVAGLVDTFAPGRAHCLALASVGGDPLLRERDRPHRLQRGADTDAPTRRRG